MPCKAISATILSSESINFKLLKSPFALSYCPTKLTSSSGLPEAHSSLSTLIVTFAPSTSISLSKSISDKYSSAGAGIQYHGDDGFKLSA